MKSRRLLCLFLLTALLVLAAHPLLAQDAPALTQTIQAPDSNGLTMTLSYPSGWMATADDHGIMLASSADALTELQQKGVVTSKGNVGIIAYLPSFMDQLKLAQDTPVDQVVKTFLQTAKIEGTVTSSTDFSVPAATAVVTPPNVSSKAVIGALSFSDGTVIFGVIPDSGLDATAMAILNSLTLEPLPDIAAVTPDSSVSLTPASFNFLEMNASVTLTVGLPDGWVTQYSDHAGLLYLGNSDSALQKASAPDVTFAPGEVAITVALPHAVIGLGIHAEDTPDDAIREFQARSQAEGRVVSDDTFSVPAAHAHLTGSNLPAGGGDVYVLKFEQGLVFVVVQPSGIIDGTVMAVLQSLQLGKLAPPAATATPLLQATATPLAAAKAVSQWASAADGTSEYGSDDWSFAQATGKPDTATCDDNGTAWASQESTGRAVLQVSFAQAVIPSQINIYQTFNPGAIVEVDVGSSKDPNKVLPLPNSVDAPGNTACPGVFSVDVSGVDTPIDFVVIYIDQAKTGNWDEIDAVQLVGTPAS